MYLFFLSIDGVLDSCKIVYFVLHELFILLIFAQFYIIRNDKVENYVSRNKTGTE